MTDKTDLIREIHEYVTTHGGENTATHLLVQAASAIQTQAAELEAVSAGGVQALSAGPATPPAEQQAQPGAVYAELHEPDATTVGLGAVWNRHSMRDFADRTHALRMQAATKAAPVTQQAGYAEVIECGNSYAKVKLKGEAFGSARVGDIFYTALQQDEPVGEVVSASCDHATVRWLHQTSSVGGGDPRNSRAWPKVSGVSRDEGHSRALLVFFAAEPTDDEMRAVHDTLAASPTPPVEQAAPKAEPGVGNSGFDYKTAADFLNGKTVSDEAVRKFVATSRWAHDERAALSATLLAMHGVLTSREAEIALLKKALLEAETAPQPAPAPLSEREAFERDWGKRHAPVTINGRTRDDGRYGDSSIQDAWESWQARAALAAQGGKDA